MKLSDRIFQGDILIVDDLADNLRVLSDTLTSEGHRVRAVRTGSMAIIGAKAAPPDVILLDIRMPEMDGFEVCRQLKSDPITQHIPIIFLSALDDAADKVKAFEAGGSDYITKPFQFLEVQARTRHHVMIQHLQKQVAAQHRQIETLAQQVSSSLPEKVLSLDTVISALDTIVTYANRPVQSSGFDPEKIRRLQEVQAHATAMRKLLTTLSE